MKSGLSYSKSEFNQIMGMLDEAVEKTEKMVEFNLVNYVGTDSVKHAKTYKTFEDQTGNLVSSIGFVPAKDGKIISLGGFDAKATEKGDGAKGVEEGRKYAEELAKTFSKGYTLIIVAGMNYAEYVEAKGYNVLTATESYLESQINGVIDRILKQAGFKR